MDMYIYSDESGVFDYLHNDYFGFYGVIVFSKQNKSSKLFTKITKTC